MKDSHMSLPMGASCRLIEDGDIIPHLHNLAPPACPSHLGAPARLASAYNRRTKDG